MKHAVRGALSGVWWGSLVLALFDMYRPGFLALGEARGVTAVAVCLLPFLGAGGVFSVLFRRRPLSPENKPSLTRRSLLLLPIALLAVGRARVTAMPDPALGGPWRVVVLGMDGATWSAINRFIESGDLPYLARLRREGATGELLSEEPSLSPRVWTTMATGVGPAKHGAEDFYSTQASIRVHRMWEVVNREGGRIGIWGWILTWPPGEPNGFLVPGWLAKGPETWPTELGFYPTLRGDGSSTGGMSKLTRAAIGAYRNGLRLPTLLEAVRTAAWLKLSSPTDRESTPITAALQEEMSADLFFYRIRREGPDFSALILYSTDSLGHQYWRDFEPAKFGLSEAPDGGRYADVIPAAYRRADRILGRLLDTVDDRTIVALVSDHGTGPRSAEYRKYSIQTDALIEALAMEGRLTGFSVGGYLHMRDNDGDATQQEVPEFVNALRAVTVGGLPLFAVRPSDPPFYTVTVEGAPEPDGSASFGDRIVGLRELLVASDFSGGHTLSGVLGLWGSPIRPGATIEGATLRDVAPTLLTFLRCPLTNDMTGAVHTNVLVDRAFASVKPRYVASYGTPPHLLGTDSEQGEEGELNEELRARLRALGYLE